jgi:hypothetical protein
VKKPKVTGRKKQRAEILTAAGRRMTMKKTNEGEPSKSRSQKNEKRPSKNKNQINTPVKQQKRKRTQFVDFLC